MTTMLGGEIVVYEASDGAVQVAVRLEQDTVWLSLAQIADLFDRDKSVISRHLRNVFTSGELERERVVAFFATTAADQKTYQVEYFNLDAILSVGYRVNSKRGTQFRIWATRTLREHLLVGFTLNERRLAERGLDEMEQAVALLAQTLSAHALVTDEGQAVLQVIQRYARSWRWLIEYDEDRLAQTPAQPVTPGTLLGLDEAHIAIAALFWRAAKPVRSSVRNAAAHWRASWALSSKPSMAHCSTQAHRSKPRICCTFWSRIIPSSTATNASARCSSSNISGATICCWTLTPGRDWPTARLWP